MLNVPTALSGHLRAALRSVPSLLPAAQALAPHALTVAPSSAAAHDYQSNVCLSLGRACSQSPAAVAAQLLPPLCASLGPMARVSVGGPGFLNFSLREGWLRGCIADGSAVPAPSSAPARPTLVDFASPNVGKELHVGHLRSAVIGDVLARVMEFVGQRPLARVSHVGDCGLPVALVVAQLLQEHGGEAPSCAPAPAPAAAAAARLTPQELSRLYVQAKRAAAGDRAAAARAAGVLGALQAELAAPPPQQQQQQQRPPSPTLQAWQAVCAASRAGYEPLFARLQVRVQERGESAYMPSIPAVLAALVAAGWAVEDGGALVVRLAGAGGAGAALEEQGKGGQGREQASPLPPLLLRKADGAWLYATSDMAALHERLLQGFQRIVYVTDAAQGLHFRQLFAAAERVGWVKEGTNLLHPARPPIQLEHAAFGVVTGSAGGRKLSSREGSDVTSLEALLDAAGAYAAAEHHSQAAAAQAQAQAAAQGSAAAPLFDPAAAERVGASAVRFFDLCHRRDSSYAFSMERAFSLKGHSASYAFYAAARLRGLRQAALAELGLEEERSSSSSSSSAGGGAEAAAAVGAAAARDWDGIGARLGQLSATTGSRGAPAGEALAEAPFATPQERALALAILATSEAIAATERALMPHYLAEHTLRLAQCFHAFYACGRVLPLGPSAEWQGGEVEVAVGRVRLCKATDACLRLCLDLCGLHHVERL